MNKIDYLSFCRRLLKDNPQIAPEEMCHNLHTSNYSMNDCAKALHTFFETTSAIDAAAILINEFRHPLFEKTTYETALQSAGYPSAEVTEALNANYPPDTGRYAISLNADSVRPYADHLQLYNYGTGDFTVEAWVKTAHSGTILSKKGGPGGWGNGGFLLVLKPDGTIKLATDDGIGFYEVNSAPTAALDGNWHHILGTRNNCILNIYYDFKKIEATPRTDRFPQLDIDNNLRLLIGATDQWQEDYNTFQGMIGEVRMWSSSVTYDSASAWDNTDWISRSLNGCWSFFGRQPDDISAACNHLHVDSGISYVSWVLPGDPSKA